MGIIIKGWPSYRGAPKELILNIKEIIGYNSFIETGTYRGESSIWASKIFSKVYTFEASKEIFEQLDLRKYSNINSFYGDSVEHLPIALIEPSIVYLDAHNSGGQTHNSYPLLNEIDVINKSLLNHTIIVDDARFCMSLFNNETYGELVDIVNKLVYNDRYVVIYEDMLIAIPRNCRFVIDEYTNKKSKILVNNLFGRFYYLLQRILNKFKFYKN